MKNYYLILLVFFLISCKKENYKLYVGNAFGTTYHIKINDISTKDWKTSIDSIVTEVNKSLSTYQKNSLISKINKGDTTVLIDDKFIAVFKKSRRIYKETNGVFDPTIGVLVNAWDFGPEKKLKNLDSTAISDLMKQVGFNKIGIIGRKVYKENKKTYLDFNAIAKGYGIDVIGRFFESKSIKNYMIELGGELRVRGKNPTDKYWKIQIEKPSFDGTQTGFKTVSLKNEAMATSGTYRHFKMDEDGNKYAHILNTKTGYPSKSNLLSASVISKLDCADVDAYATTLMALGLEKSKEFLSKHKELKALLIYVDTNGNLATYKTANFKN